MPTTNLKSSDNLKKDISSIIESEPNPETHTPEIDFETKSSQYQRETEIPAEQIQVKEEGKFIDETIDSLKNTLRRTKNKPTQIPQVRDEVTVQVEKIMEEGLADAFREMTPVQKQEFKIKGEKTAMEIRNSLRSGRVKMKKIFQLLIDWLKLLPGVNRFFLEQEAKIKADKIISLKKMNDRL